VWRQISAGIDRWIDIPAVVAVRWWAMHRGFTWAMRGPERSERPLAGPSGCRVSELEGKAMSRSHRLCVMADERWVFHQLIVCVDFLAQGNQVIRGDLSCR